MAHIQTVALVGARWLANTVKSNGVGPGLRILDVSWYMQKLKRDAKREFKLKHVPGAAFFDIDRCSDQTSPFDHMLPSESQFADYVGSLGVGNKTHVVVYDTSDWGCFSAPRVWWMFRLFGHGSVSVLDGGLKRWLQEGHPVTSGYRKPEPVDFQARMNRSWVKTYEDVLDNLDRKVFQLVDARPCGRFRGIDPEPMDNTEPGHIPGSISMPFSSFLDPSGRLRPTKELTALFRYAGVDLTRPVCASGGSAITACHVALATYLCGHQGASVYDGGWSEWYARAPPEYVISEGRGKHIFRGLRGEGLGMTG
uniref:Sulfurtransferase n=1 Tax=Paramormyrops kingsleyae TaxID=1676925 RepID=A0A3B3RLN0_9TELE|nr:3-mercaptopyruvate sulfurtransferase-like [Paramormyrops kingsleyae]